MRRMKHALARQFTILSAESLLLFVAVVVLWVRSHVVGDVLAWGDSRYDVGRRVLTQDEAATYSCAGIIGVNWTRARFAAGPADVSGLEHHFRFGFDHDPLPEPWRYPGTPLMTRSGFRGRPLSPPPLFDTLPSRSWGYEVTCPHWLLAALTVVLPAWWLRRARRLRLQGRRA